MVSGRGVTVTAVPEWRYDQGLRAVRDGDGRTIAALPPERVTVDAADPEAIGALLAAAPDLKDALQALVDALTDAEPDRQLTDQIMIVEAIAKAGRALIKSERVA
jgi:hypothetical protein